MTEAARLMVRTDWATSLLQLRVFHLGLLKNKNGDVGIGIFPEGMFLVNRNLCGQPVGLHNSMQWKTFRQLIGIGHASSGVPGGR